VTALQERNECTVGTKSARGPDLARQTHGEHLRPRRFQAVMSEDEGKRKKFRGERDIFVAMRGLGLG